MSNDFFQNKAANYEQDSQRVANVETIASAIQNHINFKADMEIMDFGSGTGLLLEQIAPLVEKITAVDISKSMNQQLQQKRTSLPCDLDIIEMDLSISDLDQKFDGIISSMTLHHIDDLNNMFTKLHNMLKPNGFIALADLKTEDGSFHKEDTGVFHFGFSSNELVKFAKNAGFNNIEVNPASIVHKPYGDYPVLLLTATV